MSEIWGNPAYNDQESHNNWAERHPRRILPAVIRSLEEKDRKCIRLKGFYFAVEIMSLLLWSKFFDMSLITFQIHLIYFSFFFSPLLHSLLFLFLTLLCSFLFSYPFFFISFFFLSFFNSFLFFFSFASSSFLLSLFISLYLLIVPFVLHHYLTQSHNIFEIWMLTYWSYNQHPLSL